MPTVSLVKRPYLVTAIFVFLFCASGLSQDINDSMDTLEGKKKIFLGVASFYSDKFNGRKTANGEIFDQNKFTAACNKLPFGTRVKVTNLKNGKSVIVRINDRLHPKMKRIVDLSKAAAKKINIISRGIAKVKVEVLEKKGSRRE